MLEEPMKGVKEAEPTAETKIVELARLKIEPCISVYGPAGTCGKESFKCILKDDLQMVFDEMKLADGILIASPRYFIVPSKLQALIERLYCVNYMTRGIWPPPIERSMADVCALGLSRGWCIPRSEGWGSIFGS